MTDMADLLGATVQMTAFDSWGLLQVPTVSGIPFTPIRTELWINPATVPVADPCLAVVLDFLATWLNQDANGLGAWTPTAGAAYPKPLKRIFAHNPEKEVFDEKHLPALYMWRESDQLTWRGDDWQDDTTDVKLLWVFPNAQQSNQRLRDPFINAIVKLCAAGIERGRTPGWVQPGDTDPGAARLGSLFWAFAGFDRMDLVHGQSGVLSVKSGDGTNTTDYPAVQMDITLVENYVYGLDRYDPTIDGFLNVNDGRTGVTIVSGPLPSGDPDMVIAFPVTNAAGTTDSDDVVGPASRLTRVAVNVKTAFGAGAWLDIGNGVTPNLILDHTGSRAIDLTAVTTAGPVGFDLDIAWNVDAPGLPIRATIGGTPSSTGLLEIIVSGSATPGS